MSRKRQRKWQKRVEAFRFHLSGGGAKAKGKVAVHRAEAHRLLKLFGGHPMFTHTLRRTA